MSCPFSFLRAYKEKIDAALLEHTETFEGNRVLREAAAFSLLNGGRRFRPSIALMMAEHLNRGHSALQSALAIECFHTASLIADDLPCMDDEEERRGKAALHRKYDEATAILVTYSLIAEGYRLIRANSEDLPHVLAPAIENASMNTGMSGASGGQLMDLALPSEDLETVLEVIRQKTATFFEIAFVFGWLFGGGELERLPLVKQGANHFGMAFQLVDDILDKEEDEKLGRSCNLAVLLGVEEAKAQVKSEVASFMEATKELGVHSPKWDQMCAALLSQK